MDDTSTPIIVVIFIVAAMFFGLFFGHSLGRESVQKDCDKREFTILADKVYDCYQQD